MSESKRFVLVHGIIGRVEFASLNEAYHHAQRVNAVAIFDRDEGKLYANDHYVVDQDYLDRMVLEKRRRDTIDKIIYTLTLAVVALFVGILWGVVR